MGDLEGVVGRRFLRISPFLRPRTSSTYYVSPVAPLAVWQSVIYLLEVLIT